jgi:S-adenosylmethionine hydrolase
MKKDEAPIVAFVTDFGRRDVYVAEMHAVLLEICPLVRIIDITHEIPPGDIGSAAYIVGRMKNRLPAGSICVAVVDPGVGTTRQAVALQCDGRYFIGPDNGIFSQVVTSDAGCRVRVLGRQDALTGACCNTFHGRDLFAPVAGRLAAGCSFERIGGEGSLLNTPPAEPPQKLKDGWRGRVVYIDRFGNVITNIVNCSRGFVRVGDVAKIPRAENYADQPPDAPFWLEGSGGTIEISMNRESAAERLKLHLDMSVWFLEEQ